MGHRLALPIAINVVVLSSFATIRGAIATVVSDRERRLLVKHRADIVAAAHENKVPPALVAAVISRESNAGLTLRDGWGDRGNAYGVMQVDRRFHTPDTSEGPFGAKHLRQGCAILKDGYERVKASHPNWSEEQQLQGSAVAYNSGAKNVRTVEGMDRGTTGGDYGSDVLERAKALEGDFGPLHPPK